MMASGSKRGAESYDLSYKNAIVTGASRGIGLKIACELALRGANIAICFGSDHSKESSELLAGELRSKHKVQAVCIQENLGVKGAGYRIVQKALEGLNTRTIDILINNAALDPPEPISVHESSPELFDQFMNVNARAPLELVSASIPHFSSSGGRIVNISSVLAQRPDVPFAAWACSKAALECLSRYWAKELGVPYRLTSNVIAIGPTMTDYHANDPPELLKRLAELPIAEKRLGTTDDIAQIAAFLSSDAARWINGDIIQGNGGMHLIS